MQYLLSNIGWDSILDKVGWEGAFIVVGKVGHK